MNLESLIALLSRPSSYPEQIDSVRVLHTHISVVFLTPRHAYKIKKPVNLGFLDFSTLEKRQHFCEEEVRLNRRLAPDVYLGVVPITAAGIEQPGEVMDWAVKMRRLPDDATLQKRLLRGEVDAAIVRNLARRIAEFHSAATRSSEIAKFGRFGVVAGNVRENFAQTQAAIGVTVHHDVFERLKRLTEDHLETNHKLIEGRAAQGLPCDTHGDLHLDHVYLFSDKPPPNDLVIIDCIEFNERFRYADPLADAAFVVMDLKFHGHRDLARVFMDEYQQTTGWHGVANLLRFYSGYRALVRAKVEGIKALESEVPEEQRRRAAASSKAHWLLALAELETSDRFPCLVLVAGLPGSGKSTLARELSKNGRFQLIQTDAVRKELAGSLRGETIYTSEWNDRTYAECLRRAEEALFEGKAVLVDGNFREEIRRATFLEAASRLGVPRMLLLCQVDAEVARQHLAQRTGDISDADWSVRQRVASQWEDLSPNTCSHTVELTANAVQEVWLEQARLAIAALAT